MTEHQAVIPCSEAVRQLWDYLDQAVSPEEQEKVEQHPSFCRTCCGELEFAKQPGGSWPPRGLRSFPPHVKAQLERFVADLEEEPRTRDLMFHRRSNRPSSRLMPPSPPAAARPAASITATRNLQSSGAVEWAPGVGNPVRYAWPNPARSFWTSARVEGSTPSWQPDGSDQRAVPSGWTSWRRCERGRGHAAQAEVEGWTEFRQGEMEDIPLPDESVDVAISNGVLNLSARKSRALAEIYRVMAPGGRICMADLDRGG